MPSPEPTCDADGAKTGLIWNQEAGGPSGCAFIKVSRIKEQKLQLAMAPSSAE